MKMTSKPKRTLESSISEQWLVLLFSLPKAESSGRVDVWRRLKRSGAVALASGGHLLPNSEENRERFEWLGEAIRNYGGDASVLSVSALDDLPFKQIKAIFVEVRGTDYFRIIEEAQALESDTQSKESGLVRLRRRLQEVVEIDFFGGPMKHKAETALRQLAGDLKVRKAGNGSVTNKKDFANRIWLTRPRPGIDRAASAWLILNFIDPKARFRFSHKPKSIPKAIPFDTYEGGGFGHRGDNCTFETLLREFRLHRKSLNVLAEMIHDADLKDQKFGRVEAITINQILKGWAANGLPDQELLSKGIELIEGLHRSIA